MVLAGCAHPSAVSSPASTAPVVPASFLPGPDADGDLEFQVGVAQRLEPALPQATAALDAAGLTEASVREDGAAKAREHGLTPAIAIAALEELEEICAVANDADPRGGGGSVDLVKTQQTLIQWLGHSDDERVGEVLLRLHFAGEYRARRALDSVLLRRAEARATACTPPAAEVVADQAASLADFAVFDQRGKTLVARALTPAEAADLAYFLVAVGQAGTPVGTDDNSFASGNKPTEAFELERQAHHTAFQEARTEGDPDEIVRTGVAYLEPLGFPGTIDRSLESDQSWGGDRYSYVMRDVALAAELAGDYALASALYRRANPGGGMCGTSVSSRRGHQHRGVLRASVAGGQCNDVVAERLLDWDGRTDSFFGPDRLAAAGFDIGRIYRGAFLTRHRDLPQAQLQAALDRAPATFAAAARARIESKGAEAWDARVWSIEGLADTLGRDGGFLLADALPQLVPDARRRAIEAIGAAGLRTHVGPCDDGDTSWFGRSYSSNWSRPISAFGSTCQTSYSDEDVAILYRALRPNMRAASPAVRIATVDAASALSAVPALRDVRKLHAQHRRAARACKPDEHTHCYDQENALETTRAALETLEAHQASLRARTK